MHTRILLALLIVSGAVQASEWYSLGKGNHGKTEDFVDISSIRVSASVRRVWTKTVLAPHFQKGTQGDSNKWWDYFLTREAFNCDGETYRSEALTIYFTDGSNSPQSADNYPTKWKPVTIEDAEMRFVCAWKPK